MISAKGHKAFWGTTKALGRRLFSLLNNEGVALMMVLVVSAIALSVMSALIYFLTVSTQISGGERRYETALEAGEGGADVAMRWIEIHSGALPDLGGIPITNGTSSDCLEDKLISATGDWDSSCNPLLDIDVADPNSYDVSFDLGNYRVYTKIVNTVEGNSGGGGSNLLKGGVASSGSGEVSVQRVPYLYSIEVESRNTTNPDSLAERARLSVLYEY